MSSSITTVTHFRYGLRAHFFAEHVKEEEKVSHWLGETTYSEARIAVSSVEGWGVKKKFMRLHREIRQNSWAFRYLPVNIALPDSPPGWPATTTFDCATSGRTSASSADGASATRTNWGATPSPTQARLHDDRLIIKECAQVYLRDSDDLLIQSLSSAAHKLIMMPMN